MDVAAVTEAHSVPAKEVLALVGVFIEEDLMSREDGRYWRTGGRVET